MRPNPHPWQLHLLLFLWSSSEDALMTPLYDPQLVGDELSSKGKEAGVARSRFPGHFEMSCGSLFSRQMPFLQLLQGAMQAEEEMVGKEAQLHLQQYQQRSLSTSYPQETNFQLHQMRTQSLKQQRTTEMDSSPAAEQLESCITHLSESETRTVVHELPTMAATTGLIVRSAAATCSGERKKRMRRRPASASKSAEKEESQRMTHIAVERNRRRVMNYHLATLRSLMPHSFVQRGDQASIVGGAIEFVKELEQHLISLRAQKRLQASVSVSSRSDDNDKCSAPALHDGFFTSSQYMGYSQSQEEDATAVDVEATLVQGHVNLKVAAQRRRGQLVRAMAAIEELRLSILHLNITTLEPPSILYSINLKMEEECKLGTADEVATAVHQIFSYINTS
uniref:BHLH domain-containing protein n=1 Tax=Musa acuminata subsp. malaccensis TaxID=214687 RepID=A0A804J7F7_MUSAM